MLFRMIAVVAVFLLSVISAVAEVATVKGGEHADFTRLVVEAPALKGWKFGRTNDGYELDLGASITAVNLESAFDRIPRDRIKAIWRDPQNGRLRFSLACACHAIAFEFRSGTVVIDIKSGLPPPGSSFEDSLDQDDLPSSANPAAEIGGTAGYDWITAARDAPAESGGQPPAFASPTGTVSLDPLREALLLQISKGAAEGVVEIGELAPRTVGAADRVSNGPWSRVGIGELPGLRAGTDRALAGEMTAEGTACPKDEDLDIASWGLSGPISGQIGLGRSGLLAEFDVPVQPAILRAARFHIFLGFGAEARQILDLLGPTDEKSAILMAMASIVDEELPSPNPFTNMESCDSSAALWATLALPVGASTLPQTNSKAVARSFSALPAHLRQQLGGALVDRFLSNGDEQTARKLRDAMLRSPTDGSPEVSLMDARFHLAEGDQGAATRLAEGVLKASGPTSAEAALTMVEAALRGGRKVDSQLPKTLDSFLMDSRGTDLEPRLLRALVLASAMSGDFTTAFSRLEEAPATFADLWSLSAGGLPDDQFLIEAARQSGKAMMSDRVTLLETASRLMDRGFPDLALAWLSPLAEDYDDESRLLAARAHLALRDASAVSVLLAGMESADAALLKADAITQLGDMQAAAGILIEAGEDTAGQRRVSWTQDWEVVAGSGPESWREAAGLVVNSEVETASGPIARGTALVAESAAARAKIEALLGSIVETPKAP